MKMLTMDFFCRRILRTQPHLPSFLSLEVQDFIMKLLEKDPRQRLGGCPDDATPIKKHKFFKVSLFFNNIFVATLIRY